jgi:hypothetical protein
MLGTKLDDFTLTAKSRICHYNWNVEALNIFVEAVICDSY